MPYQKGATIPLASTLQRHPSRSLADGQDWWSGHRTMALPLCPGHLRLERLGKSQGGDSGSLTVLSLMGRRTIGNCALRSPTAISSIRLLP